jgi:hypothetical protein
VLEAVKFEAHLFLPYSKEFLGLQLEELQSNDVLAAKILEIGRVVEWQQNFALAERRLQLVQYP